MEFSEKIRALAAEAEEKLSAHFAAIDEISFANTSKVNGTMWGRGGCKQSPQPLGRRPDLPGTELSTS